MENMNEALMLLAVGMGTVFIILLFIIYFGKGLILLINKYAPEEKKETGRKVAAGADEVPSKIVAAVTTAVNIASGGKARVVKIEKE